MSRRQVGAIAGGVGSVLLAGALAATVNLGILQAAGTPKGPGGLGSLDFASGSGSTNPAFVVPVNPSQPSAARPSTIDAGRRDPADIAGAVEVTPEDLGEHPTTADD